MNDMSALREASARKRAEMAASGEKVVILNPIQKAWKHPTSLRKAINGKCFDCVGAGNDPKPKWEIGNCLIPGCTLYPVRPYQKYKAMTLDAVIEEVEDDDED
jgi:hypothetical protein